MKKRLIAFLLVLIMVLGMLPVSAFAADGDATRYTYHLIHEFNYVGGTRWDIQATTAAESYQLDVNKGKPARARYKFDGWADEPNATTATYFGGEWITLTKDNLTKTIYAVWKPIFELHYNANGGTGAPDSQTYTSYSATSTQATFTSRNQIPTKDGYTFKGWADSAAATTAQYQPGGRIAVNHADSPKTVYAVWEKNAAPTEYTVTYYKNDGSADDFFYKTTDWGRPSEQFNIYWGKPTRDGYDFVGWAETRDATEAKYASGGAGGKQSWIKLDGPKVLYAVWQEAGREPEAPRSPSDCEDQLKTNKIKLVCVDGNHPDKVITFADVSYGSDWSMGDTCKLNFYAKDAALKYPGHAPKNPEERIYVTFKWVNDKTDANGKYRPGEWVMVETTAAVVELVDTGVEAPSQPTTAQLGNIKVTCRTNAEHSSEFPVARCMGTTVGTVTFDSVKKQWYIDTAPMTTQLASRYDSWKGYAEGTHRLVNPDAKLNARFYYDGEKWYTEDTLAIDVCCGETPVKPTALDGSFAIVCKNNKATHPYKADYIATPSEYTISDVQMDNQGYYVTATVTVAPNLAAYNTATRVEHRLVNEQDATLTITFRYDTEVTGDGNRKWQQQGDLPVVEVICKVIEAPTRDEIFGALNGLVTVTCINRFWKDGNKNMDCGQGQYAAKAGIAGQDYKLVKGEDDTTWVVTFPVTNFVKSFKQNPAHHLYTKNTLSWYIRWEDNAWTSAPVEPGVDDLVKLTHAPTDWREVAKIATGGKSDCIHTSCVNGKTGVCDYGITVPFVNFKEDVVSVVPEAGVPGSYIATFKVNRYIDTCAKACNDKNFPDAPRTHKLLTQETVQWRLYATPEADEKIGSNVPNHVWEAEPVKAGKDDVCTIAHNWVVTFNPDNGGDTFTQNVEYEGKAIKPTPDPEKTGYTFDGWYLDEAEEPFSFDTTITSDITLTAKWEAKKANVHLMIFKSGDLSKPIVDVPYAADKLAGDTIDLTKIDPSSYLDFDFEIDGGWYDDGMFNSYKRYLNGLQDKPAGLEKLLITGNWQNLKLIVTELVPVVYFDSLESLTAYQNDHSKTEGILHTTKARLGSALPTADAPTATREGYNFLYWSREGQDTDVTGQTVGGWTNLYANWEKKTYKVVAKLYVNGKPAYYQNEDFYTYEVSGLYGEDIDFDTIKAQAVEQAKQIKKASASYTAAILEDHEPNAVCTTYGEHQPDQTTHYVKVNVKTEEKVVILQSFEGKTDLTTLHTTTAPYGTNVVEFLNGLDLDLEVPGYEVETDKDGNVNWYKKDSPKYTFSANDTVNGWTNVLVKYNVAPHNIYAFARLNSSFAPLTKAEFGEFIKLNAATLDRLGLGSYNANNYISIGSFLFDELPLTEDMYFGDDAELDAVLTALETKLVLETGVDAATAEKIAWTFLFQVDNSDYMTEAGYPTDDENGYQLSGNLDLATVMFKAGDENVTGMPAVNYTYDDLFEIHDFYFAGDTFTMPADPTREGYIFEGWSAREIPADLDVYADGAETDEGAALYKAGDTYNITGGGVIFTAQWKLNTYIIASSLRINGDTANLADGKTYSWTHRYGGDYGETIDYQPMFDALKARALAVDAANEPYDAEIKLCFPGSKDRLFNEEILTYGQEGGGWNPGVKNTAYIWGYATTSYEVIFNSDGGSDVDTQVVKYGEKAVKPEDPTMKGYNFLGWFDKDGNPFDFDTEITRKTELKAQWEKKDYIIASDLRINGDTANLADGKTYPWTHRYGGKYEETIEYQPMFDALKARALAVDAANEPYDAEIKLCFPGSKDRLFNEEILTYGQEGGGWNPGVKNTAYIWGYATTSYEVIFNSDGGSDVDTQVVKYGEKAVKPEDPTMKGYNFLGWFDKDGNPFDFDTEITRKTELKAQWEKKDYIIASDLRVNGGEAVKDEGKTYSWTHRYGGKYEETINYQPMFDALKARALEADKANEPNPTKVDVELRFPGSKDRLFNEEIHTYGQDGGGWNPGVKNTAYIWGYAWTYYDVTFVTPEGATTVDAQLIKNGDCAAKPADPTKEGWKFHGWYADAAFKTEFNFDAPITKKTSVYAKFELTSTPIGDIYVRYDVLHIKQLPDGTYDLANAEVEHLRALKDSTVTAVAKNYSATHHFFNSKLGKLTGTAIQPYMGVDGKPVYTILSVYYDLDEHTLTFDTLGGSRVAPVTVRHGLTVAKPADPVYGGFLFDGWYTDKTFRTLYNFASPLTTDTTVYAKWIPITLPGTTVKKTAPKLNTSDHFAYVQGYPNGTVKPAGNITRAETAAILFRLMDDASRKTYYSTKSGFRDVASGSWYNTYVATLNNAGVITDSANGYFRPNEAITRAELAAMLAKFSETTGAANYFNDVSASYWAANAIAICAKLGWITGYPDGTFRPDRNVTRAELMAMINRATGRAPKSADAFLPGMKTWIDNTSDKWYYLDVQEATNSHSYTVKGSETWTALTSDPNWSLYE